MIWELNSVILLDDTVENRIKGGMKNREDMIRIESLGHNA